MGGKGAPDQLCPDRHKVAQVHPRPHKSKRVRFGRSAQIRKNNWGPQSPKPNRTGRDTHPHFFCAYVMGADRFQKNAAAAAAATDPAAGGYLPQTEEMVNGRTGLAWCQRCAFAQLFRNDGTVDSKCFHHHVQTRRGAMKRNWKFPCGLRTTRPALLAKSSAWLWLRITPFFSRQRGGNCWVGHACFRLCNGVGLRVQQPLLARLRCTISHQCGNNRFDLLSNQPMRISHRGFN